jgi:hypothetical protein
MGGGGAFLRPGTAVEEICVTQQAFLVTIEKPGRVSLASGICEHVRELVEKLSRTLP